MNRFAYALLALAALATTGCDPVKDLDAAFKTIGLTRMAIVRSDVGPGTVIFRKGDNTLISDNMTEFETSSTDMTVTTDALPVRDKIEAVLPKLKSDRTIAASAAVSFVTTFLPVSPKSNLNLTNDVTVEQMEAKVSKLALAQIDRLLTKPNGGLRKFVQTQLNNKIEVYIAYESWRASSMTLKATNNKDIAASAKVGEITNLISSGEGSFSYKKNSTAELKIDGDKAYTFAVKLVKLQIDPATKNVVIVPTGFKGPSGIKGPEDDGKLTLLSSQLTGKHATPSQVAEAFK